MGLSGGAWPDCGALGRIHFGAQGQRKRRGQEPFKGRKLFKKTLLNGHALRARQVRFKESPAAPDFVPKRSDLS
ncbi:protein of unknown function [Bradyrhizobium vignae]|uniref:Uncharacterized protein n=1 Tax=Bradyrhizobium vignae TaxID=1549949 RepID=A0A2U3QAK5_9BRAD|nr:protein of unknown function [Bradyrhizobium vignae]